MIEEILQAATPRALPQAEIRKALQETGREVAFTSIRHALAKLEAGNAAEQVGNSRTWRYRGGAPSLDVQYGRRGYKPLPYRAGSTAAAIQHSPSSI